MDSEVDSPLVTPVTTAVSTHNAVYLAADSRMVLPQRDMSQSFRCHGAGPTAANVREQNSEILTGAPMGGRNTHWQCVVLVAYSTATTVTRTRLNTLHVLCLSC
jgi:S-ribosylhomocysteine lyase LuxS involved in autoinducer biosynthesis